MSVVDRQRVTFLARTRNVTQRMRPSSQVRIKNMRIPSSLVINVAAAELARKSTRSDILAEVPTLITLSSACSNGEGVNQKKKSNLKQNKD